MSVKCLIVDDLEDNLLVLEALLRGDDVEILRAQSGGEALELLLTHDVALALVDVQMPEMDGFELAELMRGSERTRQIPIIFVTAGARDQYRTFKGYDSGAVDFLYKPIEPIILRHKANVFFELHRQKRQLAQELHDRTDTLRLQEMFAGVLGHDLRTPLGAILNSAHQLKMMTSDPAIVDVAERVLRSGSRMNSMIVDLLDLTRARLAGGIPVTRAPGDLASIVDQVVREHRAAAPDRRIDVEIIGQAAGQWDASRMGQVVSNLVGNAVEHGDPAVPVIVRVDGSDPGRVSFTVENGGAIDESMLGEIFDPFRGRQRLPAHRQGLGLGLFIAKQIVDAHGGRIRAAAADDRTIFSVELDR
jgi:signal transduction histidine kinase